MDDIKVSVIIPIYNGARYVKQAIDSALGQDVSVEILVLDDNSTDNLDEVMSGYKDDKRIRYLKSEERLGVAGSRNKGVKLSRGEYVAFLDADDYWAEGKLIEQLRLMEEHHAVISSTARELIRPDGSSTGRIIPIKERINYREILKTNSLSCSAVLVKRDVIINYPMEHDDSHEDYIAWIRLIKDHGFALGINKPYLKYRLSEGGKSRNKLKSAMMNFKVYRYSGFGIIKSVLYFISYAINGVKKYYM